MFFFIKLYYFLIADKFTFVPEPVRFVVIGEDSEGRAREFCGLPAISNWPTQFPSSRLAPWPRAIPSSATAAVATGC